jgi:hypothetical protein
MAVGAVRIGRASAEGALARRAWGGRDGTHSIHRARHPHSDFGSIHVSIEGSGSPPILASKPRSR